MNSNPAIKMKKKSSRHERGDSWFGFALTVPAIIVLCIVIALPIAKGVFVSFFQYKLADLRSDPLNITSETISQVVSGEKDISVLSNYKWNDFKNYKKLFDLKADDIKEFFEDSPIITYFGNTLVFVFFTVIIQLVLGMIVALILNSHIRGRSVLRGLYLIPWTIPSVVVAIVWRLMLHQNGGMINYVLNLFQLIPDPSMTWLGSPATARAAVVIASVWRQMPYMMVMILAGLQSVDMSQQEAAMIDGASGWQTFRHVTLPAISPVLITATWIAIMNNFQMYTIIANLAGRGSNTGTMTLSIAAYEEAFTNGDYGRGAAIGVIWLAVLFIITLIANKASEKAARDYQ